MSRKRAIIIGAGPAGLTAAYELLTRTDILPVVVEKSGAMGGIARTIEHKGNRMDLGGHRFFSKSDRVMDWWLEILPLQALRSDAERISYQGRSRTVAARGPAPDPEREERVMLVRDRKSRIYFLRKLFAYPIRPDLPTLAGLGPLRTLRIGLSYLRSALFPIRDERNLEQFFINRFGRELYHTFFKSYTEKVWGVACREISAEWGAQRIKGLSILKSLLHMARRLRPASADLSQKGVETSLIERFLYPKYGPGQMWDEVARRVRELGGEVLTGLDVQALSVEPGRGVTALRALERSSGAVRHFEGDYFFSSMPVQELVRAFEPGAPAEVRAVGEGLMYRDFVTVGLLVERLKVRDKESGERSLIRDNWIYVQEPDVLAGRLQIFNNWSPYLVADRSKVWIGVEYFCNEGDGLWCKADAAMQAFAVEELARIGILDPASVLDGTVHRMPKAYPAYFGTYDRFDVIRRYVDRLENLFLVGRNGMHKYNNQDHSMLCAMVAVDNILAGRTDKANLWEVNAELEYHEAKHEA
ncbi:MAG TPA: NAD(P)/FAD-dependent oxidoreductase [Planctomycetota bacterium]|nr:NAD(P)/FAD-dependent oxidoreductase [Planctomycetota bacterium]